MLSNIEILTSFELSDCLICSRALAISLAKLCINMKKYNANQRNQV